MLFKFATGAKKTIFRYIFVVLHALPLILGTMDFYITEGCCQIILSKSWNNWKILSPRLGHYTSHGVQLVRPKSLTKGGETHLLIEKNISTKKWSFFFIKHFCLPPLIPTYYLPYFELRPNWWTLMDHDCLSICMAQKVHALIVVFSI